jgi:hypothetical protein
VRPDIDEHDALLRRRAEPVDELPLFAAPRARLSDPATSHAAAASMVTGADVQRGLIVRLLMSHGPHTNDEIDRAFAWRTGTASRRTAELVADGSLIATGETRPTVSGRDARVLDVARQAAA